MAAHNLMGFCTTCGAMPGTTCTNSAGHPCAPHKQRPYANLYAARCIKQVIRVRTGVRPHFYPGSNRAIYYAAICKYNGQSVGAFAKACIAGRVSLPKKGKLAGMQGPISAWLRWFVLSGYITLQQVRMRK